MHFTYYIVGITCLSLTTYHWTKCCLTCFIPNVRRFFGPVRLYNFLKFSIIFAVFIILRIKAFELLNSIFSEILFLNWYFNSVRTCDNEFQNYLAFGLQFYILKNYIDSQWYHYNWLGFVNVIQFHILEYFLQFVEYLWGFIRFINVCYIISISCINNFV
jgi:uncharacterized membrane protein